MLHHFFYLTIAIFICQFGYTDETPPPLPAKNETINEVTLAIIKPDAVKSNRVGDIISLIEKSGLRVAAIKMGVLSKEEAAQFYQAHKDQPFYNELITFMSSGPIVILAIEGPEAITKSRKIIGATNPEKAETGTIRKWFGTSVTQNAIHGSDSPAAAKDELFFFFDPDEISPRF